MLCLHVVVRSEPLIDSGGQPADLAWAEGQGGLGVFIRQLVGLDRTAAIEAFERYLDGSRFTVDQIRFINLIIDELAKNGAVDPGRLFESPYTDYAPTGPDFFFKDSDVEIIVHTLRTIKETAVVEVA